jgi:hypothetical protein
MSLFEYLGVLISVVMGLGITHLLIGTSKVIQNRDTIRVYWVHSLWTVNVLVYILAIWWGMFWWSSLAEWTFYHFLFVTLYAVALFLLAAMLYPWDFPDDFDFEEYFFRNQTWFFGIQFVAWLVDIPETIFKAGTGLRELPGLYFAFVGTLLTLSLIGALSSNRRFHRFYAVFWLLFVLGYLAQTTLAKIAG